MQLFFCHLQSVCVSSNRYCFNEIKHRAKQKQKSVINISEDVKKSNRINKNKRMHTYMACVFSICKHICMNTSRYVYTSYLYTKQLSANHNETRNEFLALNSIFLAKRANITEIFAQVLLVDIRRDESFDKALFKICVLAKKI